MNVFYYLIFLYFAWFETNLFYCLSYLTTEKVSFLVGSIGGGLTISNI